MEGPATLRRPCVSCEKGRASQTVEVCTCYPLGSMYAMFQSTPVLKTMGDLRIFSEVYKWPYRSKIETSDMVTM